MNLAPALERMAAEGYAVVEGALSRDLVERLRAAMYRAQDAIRREVGAARLKAAGEVGVLRLMMRFDPVFFEPLALPQVLQLIDGTVSETAIMHLQNGFILPPEPAPDDVFQHRFHRDFPRYLNGYVASVNALFALDDFSSINGATLIIPGSHQKPEPPSDAAMKKAVAVRCKAGAMIAFDSTLWHAAGRNSSRAERLAINHQFTRSYIKQQIDYVRALGEPAVQKLPPRTQQLLGYYTRVVTSLDEYYRPEAERLYRKGQG